MNFFKPSVMRWKVPLAIVRLPARRLASGSDILPSGRTGIPPREISGSFHTSMRRMSCAPILYEVSFAAMASLG